MKPLPLILFSSAILVGVLTLAAGDRFASADRNGDGFLTMAEAARAMPGLTARAFASADGDGSGRLSETEFLAGVKTGALPAG